MRKRKGWLLLLLLLFSCGQEDDPGNKSLPKPSSSATPVGEKAELGGEVAAKVGAQPIPLSVVRSVANAQKLTPNDAVRRVIEDEIAAAAARTRGLDKLNPASSRLTAARARFVADRFREEAKKQGPPTDQEIQQISELYWQVANRPPAVRTIHAIVVRPTDKQQAPPPQLLDDARKLAGEIREAVVGATSEEDFKSKAEAVPHPDTLKVKVESLPPITEDGWITDGGGGMDKTYSKAAHAIGDIGGTSPVTETTFGFHVIRLVEKIPEKRMPMEIRRIAFAEQIYTQRARALYEKALKPLRDSTKIEISPAAEQLMRSAMVTTAPLPDDQPASATSSLAAPPPASDVPR